MTLAGGRRGLGGAGGRQVIDSRRSEPNLNLPRVSSVFIKFRDLFCVYWLVEQSVFQVQLLQIPVRKFLRSFLNCLQRRHVWRALSSFSLSSASPPPVPRRWLVICCCHLMVEETPRCSASPPSQRFSSTPPGNAAQKPVITDRLASSSLFSTFFSSFFFFSCSTIPYGDLWFWSHHSSIISDSKEMRFSSF